MEVFIDVMSLRSGDKWKEALAREVFTKDVFYLFWSLNTFAPVIIPQGQYFMMGDNRDNSADSRFFGFVDRKLIVGRATVVVISRKGSFLHPRWSRFFKDLS